MLEAGVFCCAKFHTGLCDLYTLNSHIFRMGYTETARTCPKCGELKLLTQFNRNCKNKHGRQYQCRACQKAYDGFRQNPPAMTGSKTCTTCHEEKSVDQFHASRVSLGGRRSQCKSCRTEHGRSKNNPPKMTGSKTCTQCGETKENTAFPADKSRSDGRKSHCSDCHATRVVAYYQTPAGKLAMKKGSHARRSRKSAALGNYTAAQLDAVYNRYESCVYCEAHLEHGDKTIDHVVPLSGGGSNFAQNLVVACSTCNTSKNSSDPTDWCATRLGHVPEAAQDAIEFHHMITHPDELVLAA